MKLLVAVMCLAACGSDSSSSIDAKLIDAKLVDAPAAQTTVSGTLGGNTFGAADAVANTVSANGFDFDAMSTDITITTFANECTLQGSHTGVANGRVLVFILASTDAAASSSPITTTGTYTVFSGSPAASSKLVEAYYEVDDGSCHKSTSEFATSGTVTVTSVGDPMTATFDVTFPDGHITGSYRAPRCSALDPNSSPSC